MKIQKLVPLLFLASRSTLIYPAAAGAGQYTNFAVSIYLVGNTRLYENLPALSNSWMRIRSQLKVDKIYIEVQRDRNVATDESIEKAKQFFLSQGVQVAGGMAASDGSIGGQFKSFCYTDPNDRAFITNAVELAARHFDEVIQDDFFFITTKTDSDIAAQTIFFLINYFLLKAGSFLMSP